MHRHDPIPTAVWIALIALAVIGADFLVVGLARGNPLEIIGGFACGGMIWALARGLRWAHALMLLVIAAGILMLLFEERSPQALVALVVTACIWIPLLVSFRWFWHAPAAHGRPPIASA